MANSVEKILGKFTSVVQELEDHAKRQEIRKNAILIVFAKLEALWTCIQKALDARYEAAHKEAAKALEQAARLRKLLSGE